MRRITVRMTIQALALLCLVGIAEGADKRRHTPEKMLPDDSRQALGLPGSGKPGDAIVGSDHSRQGNALEIAFSRRAGQSLRLYGYDAFAAATHATPPAFGTAQSDYLLGPGDELRVTIHGGKYDSNRRYTVNSNGDVIVDQLRPLTAAGLTLGDLRRQIEREVEITLSGHEAFVSLDGMRRMGILVTGAVARPGRHEVAGSATVFDALVAAGGVDKLGSLRDIRLVRSGSASSIDFYGLLQGGDGADPALRDGDRIVVPPIGPTVAVAGQVKRSGIFELPADGQPFRRESALALAGGSVLPGPARIVLFEISDEGAEKPVESEAGDGATTAGDRGLADGDLLLVSPAHEIRVGSVAIAGHIRHPGPRALSEVETLAGLLEGADLLPEPYLPFAILGTTDPATLARVMVPVDLQAVIDGRTDPMLNDDDTLIVLSSRDVAFLSSTAVVGLLRERGKGSAGSQSNCAGVAVLARGIAADRAGVLAGSPLARAASELLALPAPCPRVFDEHPDLLTFALKHSVLLRSGIARPGLYPVAGQADIADLARSAGGSGERLSVVDSAGAPKRKTDRQGVKRGDIVDANTPLFELGGHVRFPGMRPLAGAGTLRQALGDGTQNLAGLYPFFGVIERQDNSRMTRRLIAFSPHEVISGVSDRPLAEGDRIRLFAMDDIRTIMKAERRSERERTELEKNASETTAGLAVTSPVGRASAHEEAGSAVADLGLRSLMAEQAVIIHGAVRQPGNYPVEGRVRLELLLTAAGGMTAQADVDAIEVMSPDASPAPGTATSERRVVSLQAANGMTTEIGSGDVLRVNQIFNDREAYAVLAQGEVRRPGSFEVVRGERLSSLLVRAGGLTQEAYPAAAIFTRESARRQQAEAFTSAARNLDRELAMILMKPDPPPAAQMSQARQLSDELRKAQPAGRITVEADPAMLAVHPELDVVLEAGDRIYFPKRSLTVTVAGEVLAPASLQFKSDKTVSQYLSEAGGLTQYADSSRIFVLQPDGSARPLRISSWNHSATFIAPGSTIIVPRDPEPFEFFKFAQNIGSLLTQLSVSAAAVKVLSGDWGGRN
ncbi:SLBB domain-containing protein [Skermanella aerolata]|nr:SLBB domain-containing protein [Skermanella aerolata]